MSTSVYNFFYFLVVIIVLCNIIGFYSGSFMHFGNEDKNKTAVSPEDTYLNHRKLMFHGSCTNRDISISQSIYPSSGIPQYIVQIVNTCVSGCAPSKIHLHCGWFASARIVNPTTFKRISFDDCLINGGRPLKNSQIIRFTYANSYMYQLQFKSANFC
ncbi:hypothetical protein ACJIZ3_013540 [Penstemon smallii]|uniref:Protein TAPETUM DETERMINANT 1-like n=1 Tax=Penstemon smallii TaxID=265156 RepID=A0ABD3RIX5_9LAMI